MDSSMNWAEAFAFVAVTVAMFAFFGWVLWVERPREPKETRPRKEGK